MKDYYKILGLEEEASAEEIHARWIELMRKFHPDSGIKGKMYDEIAKEINEAYQVLKNPLTREEYDLPESYERGLKKFSISKVIFPVSGLAFLLILSLFFFKKPQVPAPLNLKPQCPVSPQAEWSPIPQYEPGPYVQSTQSESKTEELVKIEKGEKVALKQTAPEKKTTLVVPNKKVEPPLPLVRAEISAESVSFSLPKDINHSISVENPRPIKPSKSLEEITAIHPKRDPNPPAKVEAQLAEVKPPSLIATEKEVRQFFTNYIERYTQRDIHGFLSFFSSKTIQNKKDGLEGIRRIYENFFNQSQELRYRMEDTNIEIYQNAVEVKARYQLDQIPKEGGEKKIWKGQILWILAKENGVLKIVSIDYQHQSTP